MADHQGVEPWYRSLARILDRDGRPRGAALLVTDRLLCTCAHVVAEAAGLPGDSTASPRRWIRLDWFDRKLAASRARVVGWQPMTASADAGSDLALLELTAPVEGARPAAAEGVAAWLDRPFIAIGFPAHRPDGTSAKGRFRMMDATGLVEAVGESDQGEPFQAGFSGAPLWDAAAGTALAMIVRTDSRPDRRVALAVPLDAVANVWPELIPAPTTVVSGVAPIRYDVPQLPDHYQGRRAELQAVRELLEQDPPGRASEGGAGAVGIVGMGGIGKTVLATALAHDEKVRAHFPEGIVWLSMGIGCRPEDKASQLARALSMSSVTFGSAADARAQLGLRTARSRLLVVLDDVWDAAAVDPFANLGSGCGLIITTRDARVTERSRARIFRLQTLDLPESLEFLAASVDGTAASLPTIASEVAERCAGLPLALGAIGGLIRSERYDWQDVLEALQDGALEEIDTGWLPNPELRNVAIVLKVSIDALDAPARDCFFDCAVFYKNATIPESALISLWQGRVPNRRLCKRLARELVDRSLIQGGDDDYRIHDLYLDYLRHASSASLQEQHKRLLLAYNPSLTGWHGVNDDGYLYRHLARHLRDAGMGEALTALFADEDWMKVRVARSDGDYTGYVYDLRLASAQVPDPSGTGAGAINPSALATYFRLALIDATIGGFSQQFPPGAIVRAAELGIWSFEQALNATRRIRDPSDRLEVLSGLFSVLVPEPSRRAALRQMALEAYQEAGGPSASPLTARDAFRWLWPIVQDSAVDTELVRKEIEDSFWIGTIAAMGDVLETPDHPLRSDVLERAFLIAEADEWGSLHGDWQIRRIAHHFREPRFRVRVDAALERIRDYPEVGTSLESPRSNAIQTIAPALVAVQLRQAVGIAEAMGNPFGKACALAALHEFLPRELRLQTADEMIRLTWELPTSDWYMASPRAKPLMLVRGRLLRRQQRQVRDIALSLHNRAEGPDALAMLVATFDDFVRRETVKRCQAITDDARRAALLAAVWPCLEEDDFQSWFSSMVPLEKGLWLRGIDISALWERLSCEQRDAVLELIEADPWNLPRLAAELDTAAVDRIIRFLLPRGNYAAEKDISRLAYRAGPDALKEVIARCPSRRDDWGTFELLGVLADHATDAGRRLLVQHGWFRADREDVLPRTRHCVRLMMAHELAQAVADLSRFSSEGGLADAVIALHSAGNWTLGDAIGAASRLDSPWHRSRTFAALAADVSSPALDRLIDELRSSAIAVQQDSQSLTQIVSAVARLDGERAFGILSELDDKMEKGSYSSHIHVPKIIAALAVAAASPPQAEQAARIVVEELERHHAAHWVLQALEAMKSILELLDQALLERILKLAGGISSLPELIKAYAFIHRHLPPPVAAAEALELETMFREQLEQAAAAASEDGRIRPRREGFIDKAPMVEAACLLLAEDLVRDRDSLLSLIWKVVETFKYVREYELTLPSLAPICTDDQFETLLDSAIAVLEHDARTGIRIVAEMGQRVSGGRKLKVMTAAAGLAEQYGAPIVLALIRASYPDFGLRDDGELRAAWLAYAASVADSRQKYEILIKVCDPEDDVERRLLRETELEMLRACCFDERSALCDFVVASLNKRGIFSRIDAPAADAMIADLVNVCDVWSWTWAVTPALRTSV